MNPLFEAAWELHRFLTDEGIPYVITGGIAVGVWGEPRFTRDLDVTVLVPLGEEERVIEKVLSRFPPRMTDAKEFALKHRVLLVKVRGWEVDISFGLPGYEEAAIRRAVPYDLGEGKAIKICSAEDLIIHKAISGRPRDWEDIEGVLIRQGEKLDIKYVEEWLEKFCQALGRRDFLEAFREALRKAKAIEEG